MNAIMSLIALFGLAAFFYGPWQTHWEDWGRQRLFEVRDALFDMAAAGRLDFRDPRYVGIRTSLNTLIRFAHQLTWIRLAYYALAIKGGLIALSRPSGLELAVDRLDDALIKQAVEEHLGRAALVVAIVIVMRSPVLMAVGIVVLPVVILGLFIARSLHASTSALTSWAFQIAQREAELVELGPGGSCQPA